MVPKNQKPLTRIHKMKTASASKMFYYYGIESTAFLLKLVPLKIQKTFLI